MTWCLLPLGPFWIVINIGEVKLFRLWFMGYIMSVFFLPMSPPMCKV